MACRLVCCCLIVSVLSGCGSINTFLANSMADRIPAWAGGLPKDAPPRSSDLLYEKFLNDENAKAIKQPSEKSDPGKLGPIY